MTKGAKASYSKYPVVGDASVVRRAFALFIDAIFLFLAYMMIAIPAWSLAPGWLARKPSRSRRSRSTTSA
jgi:hypothetical protein